VHAQDQLLLGAVQGVIGFYDHTVDMQAKGKQVESVVQFARAPGEAVLVSPGRRAKLASPADFKGQLLGVTGRGSSTDFLTPYLAALRHGKAMFTLDGAIPPGGPATVLKVLNLSDKAVQDKTIDLAKTYTNEFVSVVP